MKNFKRWCCALLCLVLVFACAAVPAAADSAAQQTVKVGFFSADGYHQKNDQGIMSGYGYDFLQMLLRYNNWNYEYVGYEDNWGDMLAMLDSGEIDLVTLANKTPEREQQFDYSAESIGTSSTIMTISADNTDIIPGEYDTYNGAVVGLVQGSSHNGPFEEYAAEKGFTYSTKYYSNIDDLLADLRAGRDIDIAVTSNMRMAHNEVILDKFNHAEYYAIVKKGNEALLEQLNRGITQMDVYSPDWRADLFRKYYSDINNEVISLSVEERAYMAQLQADGTVIKAAMNPELRPYAYFENGKACGIVPELFAEIAGRLGIQYEILESSSRSEYKQQLQSGAADIDLTAFQDFGIAQQYNLKETDAYLDSCLAMLTRSGARVDTNNLSVATVQDPTEYASFNEDLLYSRNTREYPSLQACADAVKNGDCDAAYFYAYSAEQIVSADYTHRLQYTIMPDYAFGLTIGVQNGMDHRLLSILNKGVASLTDSYTQSVTLEEITSQDQQVSLGSIVYAHPVLTAVIAVIAAMLLAAALLAAVLYRNQQRTVLANRKLNRFIGYICENFDLVTEMNLKDRVRTDYRMENGQLVEKSYPYVPLVREDYEKIAHPEDIDSILQTSDEARIGKMIDAGGQQSYFEVQVKDATGRYRWYSYTIKAIAKDAQHPRNYIMFKRDIQADKDEVERQKQVLEDALEAARSASAAKGQFLSRMSHEIRTPLNAVIGYMGIAKDSDGDPDKIMHCIKNTDLAAQHLLSIINDVLDISAIESGRMKIAHDEFNLKDLITETSTLFYHQAKSKNVNFDVVLNNVTQERAVGDRLRLNQILMNLLSNALKFTPENGRVTLTVDQRCAENDKLFLQFGVSDTGIGMSEAFMARLFEPFEQETAETAQKYGGTGLGLSITHNLVEMMGGSISVQSKQNVGTTFSVTLHFGMPEHPSQAVAHTDFARVRVLVADDEKDEGNYIKATLKRCGVKADAVTDAETALKRLRSRAGTEYAYNLCILDWKMPGMDGITAAARMREEFGPELPIVLATAYDAYALSDEAQRAGIDRILTKPLFQSVLFDLLVTTFGRRDPAEKVQKELPNRSLAGLHLLLAEDNEMNREIAVTVLKKAGASVAEAVDGGEACDKFLSAPAGTYDLILMDIQMPVMNGYQATKKIRASTHPEAATIPIVAMTANAFAEDVAEALSYGMNAHIAKPVNYDKLYQIVNKLCVGGKQHE